MSDLKVGEAFKDKVYITTSATGAAKAGLATVTCTIIDESGNRAAGVVAEESDGWYTCTFTPDASGTWSTEWASGDASLYTVYFAPKIFKVGGGTIADIYGKVDTEIATIDGFHDVPAQGSVDNNQMRDVIGNKTDASNTTANQASIVGLLRYLASALTFTHQADATLSQANPVQNTWYPVLATTVNAQIVGINFKVLTTNETLEVRLSIDGLTYTGSVAATAATMYEISFSVYSTLANTLATDTGTSVNQKAYLCEGKSVAVDIRKTTAAGNGNLEAKVVYRKRV